jgi:hypothetical protein
MPDRPWMTIYALHASWLRQEYRHILGICKIYCSSTATMVTRTRLNVTLYVHWILCLLDGFPKKNPPPPREVLVTEYGEGSSLWAWLVWDMQLCSLLYMCPVITSETSARTYQNTRRHIPEDSNIHGRGMSVTLRLIQRRVGSLITRQRRAVSFTLWQYSLPYTQQSEFSEERRLLINSN